MPQLLEEAEEMLVDGSQAVSTRVKRTWDGFSDFALRDNVLEVAVGLMYELPYPFPIIASRYLVPNSSPLRNSPHGQERKQDSY
jgi:hypothetical protein